MDKEGLHSVLQMRLTALGERIVELRRKMEKSSGAAKIEAFGEIEELEARHKALQEKLRGLEGDGEGFRQEVKTEIEMVADDMTNAVEDLVSWIDAGCRPEQRPKRAPKS